MKTKIFNVFALALLIAASAFAQEKNNTAFGLQGAKFTFPLIEKWVTEYNKVNPKVQIEINTDQPLNAAQTLNIVAYHIADSDLIANQAVSYVGRYALIPVSNTQNPIIAKAGRSGLSKRVVKKLFFDEADDFGEDSKENKSKYTATIYSRESQAPTSIALANYFGTKPSELKGKKVLGDDIYLLSAIKKDLTGVAYNSLNYAYDTQSRKLKPDIALLPLNVKAQYKEVLNSIDIDNTITLLEKNNVESIPVNDFGFILSKDQQQNENLVAFIRWVLTDGQKFNHEAGFLHLNEVTLTAQKEQLNGNYLSAIK
jgi:phosphate transport system substrate-binding protein